VRYRSDVGSFFQPVPVENRRPRVGCRNNDIGAFQSFFRARRGTDLDRQFTAHLFGEGATVSFGWTEYFYLRQSSDGGSRLELRLGVDSAAKNRNPASIFAGQVLGADAACGSSPKFIDGTILKQNQRIAGLYAIENNLFVVYPAIQIRLEIRSRHAMDRAR